MEWRRERSVVASPLSSTSNKAIQGSDVSAENRIRKSSWVQHVTYSHPTCGRVEPLRTFPHTSNRSLSFLDGRVRALNHHGILAVSLWFCLQRDRKILECQERLLDSAADGLTTETIRHQEADLVGTWPTPSALKRCPSYFLVLW